MMKGQKGITLVALIITIIVMLILVGVSISVAMNGGLFTKADTASKDTKKAQVKEAATLAKAELLSDYYAAKTDAERTAIKEKAATAVKTLVESYLGDNTIIIDVTGTDGKYTVKTTTPDYIEDVEIDISGAWATGND